MYKMQGDSRKKNHQGLNHNQDIQLSTGDLREKKTAMGGGQGLYHISKGKQRARR